MKYCLRASFAFVLLLCLGCSRQDANGLAGSVTYNGEPIKRGIVSLSSVDGSTPSYAGDVVDGKFTIKPFKPGKFKLTVRGLNEAEAAPKSYEQAMQQAAEKRAQGQKAPSRDYIAEDAAGNNQEIDVAVGGAPLEIKITGPPK